MDVYEINLDFYILANEYNQQFSLPKYVLICIDSMHCCLYFVHIQ